MDNVIVGILIFICVLTGIWGWWMENGPETKKNEKKDAKKGALTEEMAEANSSHTHKASD